MIYSLTWRESQAPGTCTLHAHRVAQNVTAKICKARITNKWIYCTCTCNVKIEDGQHTV